MKAPIGMRPLSAIQADIHQLVMDNTDCAESPEATHCNACGSIIQQTTLYATVHDGGFSNCAGHGEVERLALPYCPTCEPDVSEEMQRTCIHEEEA